MGHRTNKDHFLMICFFEEFIENTMYEENVRIVLVHQTAKTFLCEKINHKYIGKHTIFSKRHFNIADKINVSTLYFWWVNRPNSLFFHNVISTSQIKLMF